MTAIRSFFLTFQKGQGRPPHSPPLLLRACTRVLEYDNIILSSANVSVGDISIIHCIQLIPVELRQLLKVSTYIG